MSDQIPAASKGLSSNPGPPLSPTRFAKQIEQGKELLHRGIEVVKVKKMYEAGIGSELMEAYARISERCDSERRHVGFEIPLRGQFGDNSTIRWRF